MRTVNFPLVKKVLLLLLWAVLGLGPVWADNNPMTGKWRASNGNTVHIPPGASHFQLTFEDSQHKKITFPAHWEKKGVEFSWTDKQGLQHSATIDSAYKSPRIRDVNPAYPTSCYKIP